jgi:sugar porter (SP) family MFS transporter
MLALDRKIVPSFVTEIFGSGNRFTTRIALLAALGSFLFGFDTGVIGSAEPYFVPVLHIGTFGESWAVGSLLIGAITGAAASGYLADRISRRWTMFASGCVFFGAAIASAFSPTIEYLVAARFVIGLGVGTASFVAPMYISEHSPKHLRGGMTAFSQLMITFGILVAYLSDYGFSGFGATNWRWMFAIEAVPGAALAIAMLFVPHTPRWLVQNGRVDEARAVLRRTRAGTDPEDEVAGIQGVVQTESRTSLWRALTSRRLLPFLVVGVVIAGLQQAVGINAVIYFGSQDLKFMGFTTGTAVYEAITLGIVNWFFAVVAIVLLDWAGRKPLLIVSAAGMVASLTGLGWYWFQGLAFAHAYGFLGLGITLFYLAFFELGWGPVMWLMISEIFPLRVRAKAMAISTMSNWTFNFLVSYFYLTMFKPSVFGRAGTMWFFAVFALIALLYTIWRIPETKNRSLEEIERDMLGRGGEAGGGEEEKAAA